MCKKNGETVDHLLLHYEIASALWNSIFGFFGLVWVMRCREIDLLTCWRGKFGSSRSEAVWKMILPCLMWCI